ncbi:MAG: MBOAT family protein [Lachnospiraceae bacterium]|nr:MBOAT family protein [Lachnospiraceae bacterium]
MQATFTGFWFFVFFAAVLAVYYLTPKKARIYVLLAASVGFYLLTGKPVLIVCPLTASLIAYAGGLLLGAKEEPSSGKARKRLLFTLIILLFSGSVVLLKYLHPFGSAFIPLGISFYTFTLLSYVIDVYNGLSVPEKNPLRLVLYGMYFPHILSGPILRYREDAKAFSEEAATGYKPLTFGLQRMLWGLFKILVISERCAKVADTVYGDPASYRGGYVVIAAVFYAFQLYTNFSGSMDMALGMSECFGFRMPENFDTPFLSETVAEFWRRWHITLGLWMKEYVFYPLLRTKLFTKFASANKERFGKKAGKRLTTFAAMFFLWLTVGLWHGGNIKYVIGSGLLHWIFIMLEEVLEEPFGKLWTRLNIDPKHTVLRALRILRTFLLISMAFVFFRADSASQAASMLGSIFSRWSFSQGGLFSLGLGWIEFTILVVSLLLMTAVEVISRKKSIRERLSEKPLVLRWAVLYALLFYVILLGYYGPGFDAAAFIYQGF